MQNRQFLPIFSRFARFRFCLIRENRAGRTLAQRSAPRLIVNHSIVFFAIVLLVTNPAKTP
jgi:hypothetical protein